MLQDILLYLTLATLGSVAVAACRLAAGAATPRVAAQLSGTVVLAGGVLLATGGWYVAGPAEAMSPAIGLLRVGLTPNVIESVRALRLAFGGLAATGLLLVLAGVFTRSRSRWLDAIARDLVRYRETLATDWQRCRSDADATAFLPTLGVLTFLASAARVYAARYPISYDESTTIVWFASRSPLDILTDYAIPNNHILHTILAHISRQLFGASALASRLPALVAGVLLIPTAAWAAWKQFGSRVALLAAAFVAALPPLIEHSAQARGYSWCALLLTLAFIHLLYALERPTRTAWALYTLCSALAIFTITTGVMGLYFIGVWMLLTPGRTWGQLFLFGFWSAGSIGVAAVLYAPVLLISGWRQLLKNRYVLPVPIGEMPHRLTELAVVLRNCWGGALPNVVALVLVAIVLVALTHNSRGERRALRLTAAFVGMCLMVLVLNRTVPPDRSFLVVLPLLAAVPAAGLGALVARVAHGRVVAPALSVALAASWILALNVREQRFGADPARFGMEDVGDNLRRCCVEGFYPDAATVATWATRTTSERVPILVHQWTGLGETIRFYLMQEGLPIARLHRFDHRAGFAQLTGYDSLYVISRGKPADADPDAQAAAVMRMPVEQLRLLFSAHAIGSPFSGSTVVTLVPRAGMATAIAASGKQINRLDYPY